jgi:hypothetical protein
VVVPLITLGAAGTTTKVTGCDAAAEVPQAFAAVTEMAPLVALAVVLIELVVEFPVHPAGNVQW